MAQAYGSHFVSMVDGKKEKEIFTSSSMYKEVVGDDKGQ